MTNKPKSYDLKKADRRRNVLIRVALTAVVIVFALGLGYWIVSNKKQPIEPMAVSASVPDKLVKNPESKPKVVLTLYEDFLCPGCGGFEKRMGSTVRQLIDTGAVQADYYLMVAVQGHDTPQTDYYASRAGNAAYCVAEADSSPSKDAFRRFHAALFAQQPAQTASSFPTNEQLIETARQAGVVSEQLNKCIDDGKYSEMVQGLGSALGIRATPTILINGENFEMKDTTGPQDLINKVTQITGNVPGLTTPAAPPPASTIPPPSP